MGTFSCEAHLEQEGRGRTKSTTSNVRGVDRGRMLNHLDEDPEDGGELGGVSSGPEAEIVLRVPTRRAGGRLCAVHHVRCHPGERDAGWTPF